MENILFPQIVVGISCVCRWNALCGIIAAIELEFRRIYLAFTALVLRVLFQVEIFGILRLAVGDRLGVLQL